jgi:6,7-dimethyl-8-ribityllumazine synthase
METFEGSLLAKGLKFGLVVSRFNEFITKKLLEGALDALKRCGAEEENIDVVWTPGSFEIPLAAKLLATKRSYHALICLGAIIRGDTPHFEYIAAEVAKGIARLNTELSLPISFGIITADSLDQAIARAGAKEGNKGWQAAIFAIEMANLIKEID